MISKGALYGGKLRYWHKKFLPIFEVGRTQETEFPFRTGTCLVTRIPFTTAAYYLGVWGKRADVDPYDDDAIDGLLREAMRGRDAWRSEEGLYEEFFED